MLGGLGSSLKELFQGSDGGTGNALLGNMGKFLLHLEVLPGPDLSLSWYTLIPFIVLPWEIKKAFLWYFVMPFGEVLPNSHTVPPRPHSVTW